MKKNLIDFVRNVIKMKEQLKYYCDLFMPSKIFQALSLVLVLMQTADLIYSTGMLTWITKLILLLKIPI